MTLGIRWSREIVTRRKGAIWIMVGRPRKTNVVRDASGKSRGEIVDFSVVLNQPHRRHVTGKHAKSELLGYALGRLRFYDAISEDQLRAGNEFAQLVRSFAADQGIPLGSPRSGSLLSDTHAPAYSFSADEATHDAERRQKRSAALSAKYDDCFCDLALLSRTLHLGNLMILMRTVCIEDRDPRDSEIGDLRLGLNALAKIFKIGEREK